MKFSILYCVYNNVAQFRNSIWTAINQISDDPYEITIIDNATPGNSILRTVAGIKKS
jgi:hypothetical protein